MDESSAPNELPSIAERLPDLVTQARLSAAEITQPNLSSLMAWEKLYEKAHTVKGLTGILPCDPKLRECLIELSDKLAPVCFQAISISDTHRAAKIFRFIATCLEKNPVAIKELSALITEISSCTTQGGSLPIFPLNLSLSDPRPQRRQLEATRLGYRMLVVKDNLLLDQISQWKDRILTITSQCSEGRAFLVVSVPLIFNDTNRSVEYWMCIAAPEEKVTDIEKKFLEQTPTAVFYTIS